MEYRRDTMGYAVDVCISNIIEKYAHLTKDFEELRLKPYKCSAGKLTIGYGRNLQDVGITQEEADIMFARDFINAAKTAKKLAPDIAEPAFYVLTDMIFNMGDTRIKEFKNMLAALSKKDYKTAADEMENSKWYKQVGRRSKKLVEIMRSC